MMFTLLTLIKKNFKILLRSKLSAVVILVGPLLFVSVLGAAFNTSSLQSIQLGAYSQEYSDLSNDILISLEDKYYHVTRSESQESCINDIKSGKIQVCAVFPPGLSLKSEGVNTITFYVDHSRINLVYLILEEISSKINLKEEELSLGHTQKLLAVVNEARYTLIPKKPELDQTLDRNSRIISSSEIIISDANYPLSMSDLSEWLDDIDNRTSTLKSQGANETIIKEIENSSNFIRDRSSEIVGNVSERFDDIELRSNEVKKLIEESNSILVVIQDSISKMESSVGKVEITDAEKIVSPITTEIKSVNSQQSNWSFIFPTLVVMMIMFAAVLLSSTLVVSERKTKAYFRNFITPTHGITFLISIYLTGLIILIIQLAIIFSYANFALGTNLVSVLTHIPVAILVISSMFIFLGMLIGYMFKSEEIVVLTSMSIASLLLFFSNTLLPIESIPGNLRVLTGFNPFVVSDTLLKKMLLFGAELPTLVHEFSILLIMTGIFVVLTLLIYEITKRKLLS